MFWPKKFNKLIELDYFGTIKNDRFDTLNKLKKIFDKEDELISERVFSIKYIVEINGVRLQGQGNLDSVSEILKKDKSSMFILIGDGIFNIQVTDDKVGLRHEVKKDKEEHFYIVSGNGEEQFIQILIISQDREVVKRNELRNKEFDKMMEELRLEYEEMDEDCNDTVE